MVKSRGRKRVKKVDLSVSEKYLSELLEEVACPSYMDVLLMYGLNLYSCLKAPVEDLASWCLNHPLELGGSKIYLLGQLHYSKFDAVFMAKVFKELQPNMIGLESPLDGNETWKGLADAFTRETQKSNGMKFLSLIVSSKEPWKQIVSICNSFAVALPRHLSNAYGNGRFKHIDEYRSVAISYTQLMNKQSLGHYFKVVCGMGEEEIESWVRKPIEEVVGKAAEMSYNVIPTYRLAKVLREVCLQTEPKKVSNVVFFQREKKMARNLLGHPKILGIVGMQHLPGIVDELLNLGFHFK